MFDEKLNWKYVDGADIPSEPESEQNERLKLVHWADTHRLPKRESLVANLLQTSAMSTVIGVPGSYKTGVVIDLACHIATGTPWRGQAVKYGPVLFIAAEGGHGIRERFTAWCQHHGRNAKDSDLYIITDAPDLAHGDVDTKLLLKRIKALGKQFVFIVVDTLSRAMAGGDENSAADMGAFIKNCDKIRKATGAHLCAIHHFGKDVTRGARGHSSLLGATDTELAVTKSGRVGTITVKKQKDGPDGAQYCFEIKEVPVGEEKTSYVVVPTKKVAGTRSEGRWPKTLNVFRQAMNEAMKKDPVQYGPGDDKPRTAIDLSYVRQEYKRLFLHGDDNRKGAESKAWNRALNKARQESLISGENDEFGRELIWFVKS